MGMADPLDDLLRSCSTASRAMRLLTAEAKRRAALLRLCCSDYQRALDRLERLAALQDLARQREVDGDVRAPPSARSGKSQQSGRNASRGAASSRDGQSAGGVSAHIASRQRFLDTPGLDSTADDLLNAMSYDDQVCHDNHQSSSGYSDAHASVTSDSSRITESLRQILEQARSIRIQEAAQSYEARGKPPSLVERGVTRKASDDRATMSTSLRAARRAVSTGATSASRSPTGVPSATRMSTMKSSRESALPHVAVTTNKAWRDGAVVDSTTVDSWSTRNRGQPQPRRGVAQSPQERRVRMGTTQARRGPEPAASTHRQPTAATSVGDDHRCVSGLGAPRVEDVDSDHARGEIQIEAAVPPVGDNVDLREGAWDEIKRYAAARRIFMGLGGGARESEDNNASREKFVAEEAALLRRLDSRVSRDPLPVLREGKQVTAAPTPDAWFVAWMDQAQSGVSEKDTVPRQGCVGRIEAGAGNFSVVGIRGACGDFEVEGGGGGGAAERWGEVERLQRSLLMLLDEVEGRRDVLTAKEQTRATLRGKRDSGMRGVHGGVDGESEGVAATARDFEDWYCWNKVAHLSRLLRAHVEAMDRGGDGDDVTVSKEAAALIENPSLAVGEDNPLSILSQPSDGGCAWQQAWQDSKEVQGLGDTACFALVNELQAEKPWCCPLDRCWPHQDSSSPPRGTPAEQFGRQLRHSFILTAERDVFRLVTPPLARGLSHAFRQPPPSNQQRHCPDKHSQDEERDSRRHLNAAGSSPLEHLREKVSRATVGQREEGNCANPDEVLWIPILAVFRAVDAVLSGGGKPRISFVRRRSL